MAITQSGRNKHNNPTQNNTARADNTPFQHSDNEFQLDARKSSTGNTSHTYMVSSPHKSTTFPLGNTPAHTHIYHTSPPPQSPTSKINNQRNPTPPQPPTNTIHTPSWSQWNQQEQFLLFTNPRTGTIQVGEVIGTAPHTSHTRIHIMNHESQTITSKSCFQHEWLWMDSSECIHTVHTHRQTHRQNPNTPQGAPAPRIISITQVIMSVCVIEIILGAGAP